MAPSYDPIPSSAMEGFFQVLPSLKPQYKSSTSSEHKETGGHDPILRRILSLYLPDPIPGDVDRSLHDFAIKCLKPSTLRLTVDCERNPPVLRPLNTFGEVNKTGPLVTSEGWRLLKDIQTEAGIVALGYASHTGHQSHDWNRRIHQFANCFVWAPSSAVVTCPAAMTDGAAVLLGRHLAEKDGDQPGRAKVIAEARRRLISHDPAEAWTSGQWMTERTGGSDVSQTETLARRLTQSELHSEANEFASESDTIGMPLGPWRIDGFKWFSSAIDADMVVLLARTEKGISTFYAPLRRDYHGQLVLNGIRMTRLKEKLGTKGLPTAELEIKGMRAWLIGEEGKGTKEISAILNVTRIWTAIGGVAGWARGLAVSRAYSVTRKVKGDYLVNNKAYTAWLGAEVVKYRASTHLTFLGVALLGISEQGNVAIKASRAEAFLPSEPEEAALLLRALTPVAKAQCSTAATLGLRECMESLGGVGYCENNDDGGILNIAKIFRDSNVGSIWEGTTDVLGEDLVRAATGRGGKETMTALQNLINRMQKICTTAFPTIARAIEQRWSDFTTLLGQHHPKDLVYFGRTLLQYLEETVCAGLLVLDALSDGDKVAADIAQRWAESRLGLKCSNNFDVKQRVLEDRSIFLPGQSAPVKFEKGKL